MSLFSFWAGIFFDILSNTLKPHRWSHLCTQAAEYRSSSLRHNSELTHSAKVVVVRRGSPKEGKSWNVHYFKKVWFIKKKIVNKRYANYDVICFTILARLTPDVRAKLVSELWVNNGGDGLAVVASLTWLQHSLVFIGFQPSSQCSLWDPNLKIKIRSFSCDASNRFNGLSGNYIQIKL